MRNPKKLFYVPGLISLIGILIALPSFHKKVTPIKEYCLPLFVPLDCNGDIEMEYQYSNCGMEKTISKKKKLKFVLNENLEENKKKMYIIRYEALKLKYNEDTSTVILITLSDSISYGEFVSLIDMCEFDKHKRYASWDNKFVISGEWPKKEPEIPELHLIYCGYRQPENAIVKPTFFELVNQKINVYYTPKGFYLLLGWIFLLISFLYFKKRSSVLQEY